VTDTRPDARRAAPPANGDVLTQEEETPAQEAETPRRGVFALLEGTIRKFITDGCPQMAAALSFYTFFSLPPLLLLLLIVTGTVIDPEQVEGRLLYQIQDLIGSRGAEQVRAMVQDLQRPEGRGPVATTLGALALMFGATAAFAQLQNAMNTAWQVQQDPARGDIRNFLVKRVFSLAMVLAVAFLLLVSLVISAGLALFGELLAYWAPEIVSARLLWAVENLVALAVITALFAAMLKVLPDAEINWHDVRIGAFVTALFFVAGKFGIGLYLGRSDAATAYGAAGSLAIVMLWVYYSSMVFLFGTEFTHVYATRRGQGVRPDRHAVRVVTETREYEPPS
jgi:membrane protein